MIARRLVAAAVAATLIARIRRLHADLAIACDELERLTCEREDLAAELDALTCPDLACDLSALDWSNPGWQLLREAIENPDLARERDWYGGDSWQEWDEDAHQAEAKWAAQEEAIAPYIDAAMQHLAFPKEDR